VHGDELYSVPDVDKFLSLMLLAHSIGVWARSERG